MAGPTLAPETRVGSYVLLKKLGAGGIGEVWKARDRRLNRVVALKFISHPDEGGVLRDLLREARTASALNHPNIVTVFDIGELEGSQYLAMEFVSGESLRERLRRTALPLAEALEIGLQTASGLAAAHTNGIVHRDLKPENIMLRDDGYVKLVDFGLAKVLPWAEGTTPVLASQALVPETTTETGQVIGTFHYMSPEQARGQPVTAASDVFSFGIVFYEMLSQRHPFRAESTLDTLAAILNREPAAISTHCPGTPPPVSTLLERALAKDPARRFPSGVELLETLQQLKSRAVPVAPVSAVRHKPRWLQALGAALILLVLVAVLWFRPGRQATREVAVQSVVVMKFKPAADDARAAAMTDAMAEELDAALSRRGLRVASRASAAVDPGADVRTLGAQLGVDAVLTGTVRSYGEKIRVHVELVSTRTGFELWTDTVTTDASDPLAAGEKAAAQVADGVKAAVGAPK